MSSRNSNRNKKRERDLVAKHVFVISTKRLPGNEAVITVGWTDAHFFWVKQHTAKLHAFGDAAKSVLVTRQGTKAWVLTSFLSDDTSGAHGVRLGRLYGFIPDKNLERQDRVSSRTQS